MIFGWFRLAASGILDPAALDQGLAESDPNQTLVVDYRSVTSARRRWLSHISAACLNCADMKDALASETLVWKYSCRRPWLSEDVGLFGQAKPVPLAHPHQPPDQGWSGDVWQEWDVEQFLLLQDDKVAPLSIDNIGGRGDLWWGDGWDRCCSHYS